MSDVTDYLDTVQKRADAATGAHWRALALPDGSVVESYDADGAGGYLVDVGVRMEPADAEFIAAARTDVPALVAVARRVVVMLNQVECDDRAHLAEFGQHHPHAGWAVDALRDALAPLGVDQ